MKNLTIEERFYLAGFIDGDGSIFAQLVRSSDSKYKFKIRLSVGFYQKKQYKWFLTQIQKDLKCGSIRTRREPSEMCDYVITGTDPVRNFLLQIRGCLRLKQRQANLVLEILEKKKQIKSKADFIEVAKLTDKVAALNNSKKRTITADLVAKVLLEDDAIL